MLKIPALIVLLSLSMPALSQVIGSIVSGTVEDGSARTPIEFASVELLKPGDSTVVKGAATNAKGRFTMDGITPGKYLVRYTFIGYENVYRPVSISAGQSRLNLGTASLAPTANNMNEVVVTGRKSMLNNSIDRKVYNVAQDIMAQSGSASDVLKNVPSVDVDIDGQVSLRGSPEVMILINGRPSPLMGKSRAEVLQQLPANSIERIEVITNPTARYKPDGTSGIINIVLKKNTKGGWNGTVTANAGNRDRYNGGLTLNYKPGKLNVFGSYSIRQDARLRYNDINREYLDSNLHTTRSYYKEHSEASFHPISHLVTAGFDYEANSHNSFGLSGNYTSRNMNRNDLINKFYYGADHSLSSNYDRVRHGPEWQKEKEATGYWEHHFPGEEHTLRIEGTVSKSDELEDNHFSNVYRYPPSNTTYDNTRIGQGDNQQQVTVDYSRHLGEDAKLEAGYMGTFTQQDFNFYGEYYNDSLSKFVKDAVKTNRFLYKEYIHAWYGTFEKSYDRFGFTLGLRVEEALIKGDLVTRDSSIHNDYFKIYPTLHLSYRLSSGELQLNYSRRVHRPEGDDINPFPEYQDPYNIRAGNPTLLPEVIHSVEAGYKWQNKTFSFIPSLYYRYKQHGFTFVTLPVNDSVLLTTIQNLSADRSAGLELIVSARAGKFFTANLSTNFFYNEINASNLGYIARKSILSMNTTFNSTFTITPTTMVQVSANYRSARLTPQGKIYPGFVLNMGIRQDVFKKKMSVLLTASDLLQTFQQKTELNSPYMKQTAVGKRDARIFYLGLSYRFGKIIRKADDKMQFENGL